MASGDTHGLPALQYLGKVGYNWHGSYPVFVADAKFEPNFRLFNMQQDVSLANEDLHNKLFVSEDGTRPQANFSYGSVRVRGWPILYSSILLGSVAGFMTSRGGGKMRSTVHNLWVPIRYTALFAVVGSAMRVVQRERQFVSDFERNQYFAYDEIKAKRDEERVRKALEAKKYADDPLTEYRVKAWQVSRAGV